MSPGPIHTLISSSSKSTAYSTGYASMTSRYCIRVRSADTVAVRALQRGVLKGRKKNPLFPPPRSDYAHGGCPARSHLPEVAEAAPTIRACTVPTVYLFHLLPPTTWAQSGRGAQRALLLSYSFSLKSDCSTIASPREAFGGSTPALNLSTSSERRTATLDSTFMHPHRKSTHTRHL